MTARTISPRGRIPDSLDFSDGRPVFLVGTGPSLAQRDLTGLHRQGHVVAVKEAAFLPGLNPCCCVSSDWRWPIRRHAELGGLPFPVLLAVDDDWAHPVPEGATLLERLPYRTDPEPEAFSWRRDALAFGASSGFSALNLAVICGARRVVLLGYDYAVGPGGQHHADPSRYWWWTGAGGRYLADWIIPFHRIEHVLRIMRVSVTNASPTSLIQAFPKGLTDEFAPLRGLHPEPQPRS